MMSGCKLESGCIFSGGCVLGKQWCDQQSNIDNMFANPFDNAERIAELEQANTTLQRELQEARRERDTIRVAAAVMERNGMVQIFQRGGNDSYTGKWEFPGGKAEPEESLRDALCRELREELAVECVIGRMLDHYVYQYPKRAPIDLSFFAVTLIGEPKLSEHTASAWVHSSELPAYDLMNGDMEFVATRYTLRAQLAEQQKAADALRRLLKEADKALLPSCGFAITVADMKHAQVIHERIDAAREQPATKETTK